MDVSASGNILSYRYLIISIENQNKYKCMRIEE